MSVAVEVEDLSKIYTSPVLATLVLFNAAFLGFGMRQFRKKAVS